MTASQEMNILATEAEYSYILSPKRKQYANWILNKYEKN